MPKPIKWRELVRRLRALGWGPPEGGGKHLFPLMSGTNCRGGDKARDLLYFSHADLRISLRQVRGRQRSASTLEQMGRHAVPALRLEKAAEEALGLCVLRRR